MFVIAKDQIMMMFSVFSAFFNSHEVKLHDNEKVSKTWT
jgi:hypothetical protein